MKKTRILALILVVVAVASMFVACNGNEIRSATVTIKVTDTTGNVITNGVVTVEAEDAGVDENGAVIDPEVVGPTVLLAAEAFLVEQGYALDAPGGYALDAYGNTFAVIGDVDNSSADSEYIWSFKINGAEQNVGMAVAAVYEGETVEIFCKKNPYANVEAE